MQEPLRIVCVEQLCEDPGNVARILTDSHLAFGWKRAASTGELIRIAADFNPHIVLCTDDLTNATSQALLGALRLLCSQTPVILVSSMCDGDGDSWAAGRRLRPIEEDRPSDAKLEQSIVPGALRNDSDARFLRAAFSVILESSMTPAVMTDGAGWVTDANTSACRLLSSRCERSLMTLMGEVNDQCTAMPHWLPQLDDANQGVARHRLAYIDEWSLLPTRVHVDELIGRGTTSQCECR
jgi:PAS domain-containing protein